MESITVEVRYTIPKTATETYEFIIKQISMIETTMGNIKEWSDTQDLINTRLLCEATA